MHLDALRERLQEIGQLADDDLPLAETLTLLGALDRKSSDIEPYQNHLNEMRLAFAEDIKKNPDSVHTAEGQLARLNAVIHTQFGYHGDDQHQGFTDPTQINFLDTIDQRSGIPVALAALYLELAQTQNWRVVGLNFPGHFVLRLEEDGERLLINPYDGKELNAGRLRNLLKHSVGPEAELNHEYYNPVTLRDVALRFCNNRKTRFLQLAKYDVALHIVEQELWFAPNEPRLYFDAGMISVKLDRLGHAIEYLKKFIEMSKDTKTIAEARTTLYTLQRNLQ
jgi:regulator of sirC expression with transglutaminase-like and TPR domain